MYLSWLCYVVCFDYWEVILLKILLVLVYSSNNWLVCFFLRSVVYQQNSKESATLQPFFTLQLDIQSDKIRTVQEALETLVARESVQGYTSKTKQEVLEK